MEDREVEDAEVFFWNPVAVGADPLSIHKERRRKETAQVLTGQM